MEIYSKFIGYLLLFMAGGIGGWVLELLYRRIVHKKWVNPGLLNGPILPLYGFGAVILYALSEIAIDWWYKIALFFIVLTAIEYLAGIVFIKGMGLKLWDYHRRWGNIQGIICPLFSVFWTLSGTLFLWFCYPACEEVFRWIDNHLYLTFFLGIPYGVFLIDFSISIQLSIRLRSLAQTLDSILPLEQIKEYIMNINRRTQRHLRFLLPFKTANLNEAVEQFVKDLKHKARDWINGDEDRR